MSELLEADYDNTIKVKSRMKFDPKKFTASFWGETEDEQKKFY